MDSNLGMIVKMVENVSNRMDAFSHVAETMNMMREDFGDMKKTIDQLKNELSEMRHKENNALMRISKEIEKDYLSIKASRPLFKEILDDHGIVREKELWGYFKECIEKWDTAL